MKLRVLVVDDTALFRRVVSDALAQVPEVEVVGTAPNGKIALERVETLSPDLITLDIEMPEMDGLEVLAALKQRGKDCGVVVVSALTRKGGELTIRALEQGAFDFVTKPGGGDPPANLAAMRDALAPMISAYRRRWEVRAILKGGGTSPVFPSPAVSAGAGPPVAGAMPPVAGAALPTSHKADLVCIGVSTGGPNALARVLPALPANFPAPVLVVQHMPPLFTQSLAASLAAKCAVAVREAAEGERLQAGTVYIAPGGRQMKMVAGPDGQPRLHLTDDPPENNCRPSVDYLFRSVANHYPGRVAAVIMTGMGSDGVTGLRLLKRKEARIIAQDEASCVVYGMPGEAVKAGVVDVIAPLERLADEIRLAVKEARR